MYETLINAIDAYLIKEDKKLTDELDKAGFVDAVETVATIAALEDKVTTVLTAQTVYLSAQFKKHATLAMLGDALPKIKAGDDADAELYTVFKTGFQDQIPKLATDYISKMDSGLVVSQITNRTTAWIEDWSGELASKMKLTSYDELQRLLTEHLSQGKGVEELTRAFMDSGIRDEYYRARSVALTEMLRAHSVAKQESIKQDPSVTHVEWQHTGSRFNKPRDNHVAMDGQIVEKGTRFTLLGADGAYYYPFYPRDISLPASESVNCHCYHQGIADQSVLGLTIEERQRLQQEAIDEDNAEYNKEQKESDLQPDLGSGKIEIGHTNGGTAITNITDIDFSDERAVRDAVNNFNDDFAKVNYEHALVVSPNGQAYEMVGYEKGVNIGIVGNDALAGAVVTHSHPAEFADSFSKQDFANYFNNNLSELSVTSGDIRNTMSYNGAPITAHEATKLYEKAEIQAQEISRENKVAIPDTPQLDTMRVLANTMEGLTFHE